MQGTTGQHNIQQSGQTGFWLSICMHVCVLASSLFAIEIMDGYKTIDPSIIRPTTISLAQYESIIMAHGNRKLPDTQSIAGEQQEQEENTVNTEPQNVIKETRVEEKIAPALPFPIKNQNIILARPAIQKKVIKETKQTGQQILVSGAKAKGSNASSMNKLNITKKKPTQEIPKEGNKLEKTQSVGVPDQVQETEMQITEEEAHKTPTPQGSEEEPNTEPEKENGAIEQTPAVSSEVVEAGESAAIGTQGVATEQQGNEEQPEKPQEFIVKATEEKARSKDFAKSMINIFSEEVAAPSEELVDLDEKVLKQVLKCWKRNDQTKTNTGGSILITSEFDESGNLVSILMVEDEGNATYRREEKRLRKRVAKEAIVSIQECTPLKDMPRSSHKEWRVIRFQFHY